MTDEDRKELMDLIAEYGTAAIIEGSAGRIRHFKRIVKHVEAVEQAAIHQCLRIVETYEVSVGNSAAGEIACEMTMANLREIRDEMRELLNGEKS